MQAQRQLTRSLLNKLEVSFAEDNTALNAVLPQINSLLRSAVSACDAATELQESTSLPFLNKESVAAGKKMELQPRFTVTSTGPGRKNKKPTLW